MMTPEQQRHNFDVANFHRTAAAGIRDAELAERALSGTLPEHVARVARARAAKPTAPWKEIAADLGMTKDQAAAIFRRLRLQVAGDQS